MPKILLIEDDPETQLLFAEMLRLENFDVDAFSHGKDALTHLEETQKAPDVIVMDLSLPFMTPEDLVENIRKNPRCQKTPIVIVSGNADIQEFAVRLKANGYARKPFQIDSILLMLNGLTT